MEEMDRLSNLPDAIIHKILSLLPTVKAVQTCVLSKSWKYQWTHVDTLDFDFYFNKFHYKRKRFRKFVNHVLRCRQPSISVTQLSIQNSDDYYRRDRSLFDNVLAYSLSRGGLEVLETEIIPVPSSFSKKLRLQFSSLKTLKLDSVSFSGCYQDDFFSNFNNLDKLELISCSSDLLNINCPLLATLIIDTCPRVDKFVISAPKLKIFRVTDFYSEELNIDIDKCPILEDAEISYGSESISPICSLAKKLSNAKSLTVRIKFYGVAMSGRMLCNNAIDEETMLEEQGDDEPENPWLTIRKLEFYLKRFRQSEVEAELDYVTSFRLEEIGFVGMLVEKDVSDEESTLFHNDFGVFLPNLLKSKTLKTLKVGPCSFKNLSSLSLGFKSLTTLQLSGVSIEYDIDNIHHKIIHGCDLFSGCLNLERLKLLKCKLKNLERLIIKAPRLKFFEFESIVDMQLRFENCSLLDEVKIHYTLPVLIAWHETDYQNQENFFDMMYTDNGGGHNRKETTLLLKFSMGKFVLSCINSDAEEEAKVVMEFNKDGKETERSWCFDGAKVLQSNPSCWGQLHNNI